MREGDFIDWIILIPPLIWIAYSDYTKRIIPNTALALILAGAFIFHYSSDRLNLFIGGLFGCLFILFVFYAAGGMGAGDVKLAAAVGATLGYWRGVHVIMLAILLSVLFILVSKARRGELVEFLKELKISFQVLVKTCSLKNFIHAGSRESIPLGVFFLPATLIYLVIERWLLF